MAISATEFPTLGHAVVAEKLSALPYGARKKLAAKWNVHQSRISSVWPGGKMPNRQLTGLFFREWGVSWDAWDKKPKTITARPRKPKH